MRNASFLRATLNIRLRFKKKKVKEYADKTQFVNQHVKFLADLPI